MPDAPVAPEVLRGYVHAQRELLERALEDLDDVESVHQARTRARRIRSVLGAWSDATPARPKLRADLRWLGQVVGRLRDVDVLRERLDHHAPAVALLDEERRSVAADVRRSLGGHRAERMRRRLVRLDSADPWEDLPRHPLPDVAPVVLLAERDRVLRRDRLAARPGPDPAHRLHDVRKAAKRLRYAAEPAGEDGAELAARAQVLQDLLGAANDALVAADWLDRAARDDPAQAARHRIESTRQWAQAHVDAAAYERAVEDLRTWSPG